MPRGGSCPTDVPCKDTQALLCVVFAASPGLHRSPALTMPSLCPEAHNPPDSLTLDTIICKLYALCTIYFLSIAIVSIVINFKSIV